MIGMIWISGLYDEVVVNRMGSGLVLCRPDRGTGWLRRWRARHTIVRMMLLSMILQLVWALIRSIDGRQRILAAGSTQ